MSVESTPRAVRLADSSFSGIGRLAKRALDIVVAVLGLVLLSPLAAFVAWRIKRESPSGAAILFRQTRLGEGMRPFTMLKFRSLVEETTPDAHAAFIAASIGHGCDPPATVQKLDYGDHVTRTGRWIRRTSIDELPQLWNVLRGEMSVVGPRPCIPYEVEHMRPRHLARFSVPAGITGLWQVEARGSVSFAEALEMDVRYVESRSFAFDVGLLMRTLAIVMRPDKRAR